jgi:uncharacterized protein YlxW (UPF0749 family)
MTGSQRHGRDGSPGPDDDVVPHPFGPGRLGERSASADAAAAEPPAETDDADERPAQAQGAAVPEEPSAPAGAAEPEPATEPKRPVEPEMPAGSVMKEPAVAESSSDSDEPPAPAVAEDDGAPAVSGTADAGRPRTTVSARRRDPIAAALIGVLTLLLGFAFAVQVRNAGNDQALAGAREEDLVRILDDLNAREERLRAQISDQRVALQQLTSSDSQSATALEEARKRAQAIGILNGTIAAQGPGLTMTVRDPNHVVRVADILDAIQELRGAGAETMQIDAVRVGVSTAVTGNPGGLMIDGHPITAPYDFVVIGSPQNMETAMNIPGGVVPRFTSRGAAVTITQSDQVVVDALRPLDTPQYASPNTGN